MNYLEKRVNDLKKEILDLKTACEYSSTRSAFSDKINNAYTGLYRITYAQTDDYIISIASCSIISGTEYLGMVDIRTAIGNTQILEVDTDYTNFDTQQIETGTVSLMVSSNTPIVSITRIS